MTALAKFFSVVFQPILMPLFGLFLIYQLIPEIANYSNKEFHEYYIYILCLSFTIILPLAVFGFFYWMGWVTDVNLTKRNERVIPFFIAIGLFVIFYFLVRTNPNFNELLYSTIFGSLVATTIANIITSVWKISIHALGVSSILGMIFSLSLKTNVENNVAIILLALLVIIIAVSRVHLKRHTVAQVIGGSILGFSGTFLAVYYNFYI